MRELVAELLPYLEERIHGRAMQMRSNDYERGLRDRVKAALAHEPEGWISVQDRLPECERGGTACLIWPRPPDSYGAHDGFAYFGKGVAGRQYFYLHGAEIPDVTHWQPLPAAPKDAK